VENGREKEAIMGLKTITKVVGDNDFEFNIIPFL